MLTCNENLLVTASEECAEISEAISKSLRFGLDNHHPNNEKLDNKNHIMREFYQLQAVIEELQYRGVLPTYDVSELCSIKAEKLRNIETYQKVSVCCGTMEPPDTTE